MPAAVLRRLLPKPPLWVAMYHSIAEVPDDPYRVTVSPVRFARQLHWLGDRGLRGVSVRELLAATAEGRERGLVGLTFDDGYADFVEHAVPALARHGMTATLYVVAGLLGGDNAWDDGPRLELMTAGQVRTVAAAGLEVGSHTMTHPRLAGADAATLATEIGESRQVLQEVLQTDIAGFCYPYGSYDDAAADAVQAAGYDHACVTGDYVPGDRFTLPRCYVSPRDTRGHLVARLARHHLRQRRCD